MSPCTPTTHIQWKGTDVCLDLYCACGERSHFDGAFAYTVRCPHCRRTFALGTNVTATETTDPHDVENALEDDNRLEEVKTE